MKKIKKKEWLNLLVKMIFMFLIINIPMINVRAGDFDQPISSSEKAVFKEMFKPLFTIYNMFKFLATVVGAVYLSWGALNLMTAGDDLRKREMAKSKLSFTVLGMMIVWGIPYFLETIFTI